MITEGMLRRHTNAYRIDRDIALLDVAQEYVLEFLRQQGAFDDFIVFKGGTALRKFVFGSDGRFSVDLDFGVLQDDESAADTILDLLDGGSCGGVTIRLARRDGPNAQLHLDTPLGPVTVPAAISIRQKAPWLPPQGRAPVPFPFLDQGLEAEFRRSALPVLDIREIAAEKIAAFWRRRMARDLYDLEHLGRIVQSDFDGLLLARLAALKIYFDVVEGTCPRGPVSSPSAIFGLSETDVVGQDDLGRFGARTITVIPMLAQCRSRYRAIESLPAEIAHLLTTCRPQDQYQAHRRREELIAGLNTSRT